MRTKEELTTLAVRLSDTLHSVIASKDNESVELIERTVKELQLAISLVDEEINRLKGCDCCNIKSCEQCDQGNFDLCFKCKYQSSTIQNVSYKYFINSSRYCSNCGRKLVSIDD